MSASSLAQVKLVNITKHGKKGFCKWVVTQNKFALFCLSYINYATCSCLKEHFVRNHKLLIKSVLYVVYECM